MNFKLGEFKELMTEGDGLVTYIKGLFLFIIVTFLYALPFIGAMRLLKLKTNLFNVITGADAFVGADVVILSGFFKNSSLGIAGVVGLFTFAVVYAYLVGTVKCTFMQEDTTMMSAIKSNFKDTFVPLFLVCAMYIGLHLVFGQLPKVPQELVKGIIKVLFLFSVCAIIMTESPLGWLGMFKACAPEVLMYSVIFAVIYTFLPATPSSIFKLVFFLLIPFITGVLCSGD